MRGFVLQVGSRAGSTLFSGGHGRNSCRCSGLNSVRRGQSILHLSYVAAKTGAADIRKGDIAGVTLLGSGRNHDDICTAA